MTRCAGASRPADLAERWVTINGLRCYARLAAPPVAVMPPIVLVHGLGVSSRYLLPIARRLAQRSPVVVPDLPGHGRSDHPPAPLDVAGLADALLAWLDALALRRVVLLGNSLGCQTVVELAVRCPERVLATVLTGPTGDPRVHSLARWLGRLLRDLPREPFSLIPLQALAYLKAGPRRVFRTARAMVNDPFVTKLPLVVQPSLVVRGGRDPIASQAWAEDVAGLLPRGRLVVIPGAAHAVNYNAPAPLAAAIGAFLDGLGLAPQPPGR